MCALVLAEEGNLVRTAERLHTSHSKAGRKVKSLQEDWGVELFRKNSIGFELTEEGRSAIRDIGEAIEHAQRAFDHTVYTTVKNRRPFHIGYSFYVHQKILPFLKQQRPPGSSFSGISLKADATIHLVARVLRGELHVGFGVMPVFDKELWTATVAQESFSVCIPADHPLRDKLRLSARDLIDETLCWVPHAAHPAFYEQITDYLFGVGIHPYNLQEASAITQGIDLAANKMGVALVPQSAARFRHPGVLFKPLTDRLLRIETAMFVRRDRMQGDVREFVDSALIALRPLKTEL